MANHTLAKGGIRRGPRRTADFTTLSNAVINDARLSFRARGVLMWLLSKPADWRTRSVAIAVQSPREGRDAVRTAMRELEEFGYLVRERVRHADGTFSIEQTIREIPVDPSASPGPERADTDSSGAGDPGSTQRMGSPRTDTNTPDTSAEKSQTERTPKRVGVKVSAQKDERFEDLAAACRERGLAARWDRIKPEQAELIDGLLKIHGVDALADAARDAHRPSNPTRWAQGYVGAWYALPIPGRESPAGLLPMCGHCANGWIEDPVTRELDRRCACRTTVVAA